MITALDFATRHGSFWKANFPALESYVRLVNSGAYERYADPLDWTAKAERNYFVSEVGFCLAKISQHGTATVDQAMGMARDRLSNLPGISEAAPVLSASERRLASSLSNSLISILHHIEPTGDTVFDPSFKGCGLMLQAYGDCLRGSTLFEVKSVERAFRSSDFRQLLTYFFLNRSSQVYQIQRLGVINPRTCIYFSAPVDELIYAISGSNVSDSQSKFWSAIGMAGASR